MIGPSGATDTSPSPPMLISESPSTRLARLGDLFAGSRDALALTRVGGRVNEVTSSHIRVGGLSANVTLGTLVEIDAGERRSLGEVIAIQPLGATIKLFSAAPRIGLGSRVWVREDLVIKPCASWIGRVVNALGEPIDGDLRLPQGSRAYRIDNEPLEPMSLDRVHRPVTTGVRAIDLFTPLCAGQRVGIFAGSGV